MNRLARAERLLKPFGWPEAGRSVASILARREMGWIMFLTKLSPARETALRKALGEARLALSSDSKNVRAQLAAAAAAFHLGHMDEARDAFDRALALKPNLAPALLWRAHYSIMENDPAAAKKRAEAALRVEDSAWGRCLRGEALLRLGDKEGALAELNAAAARDPRRPWIFVLRSEAHRDLKRFDEAAADLDAVVRLDPGPWAYAMRARTGFNFRDKKKALRDLDRCLKLAPRFMEGYAYRAEALRRVGRLKESLRDFDKVLSSGLPGLQRVRSWRGALLAELGRHGEAVADFTADIDVEQEANIGWQLSNRAQSLLRLGRFREAVEDMNRAVRINPKNGWIFGVEGREGGTLGRGGEVLALLGRGIKKEPRWPWGWAWRGETLARAGRFKESLADLERAVKLDPRSGILRAWRGLALRGLGRAKKAAADFDACIRLDPKYPSAYGWRADLLMKEGKFAQALPHLDRLLALDPLCSWAFAWRGECRLRGGDARGAMTDLENAVNLDGAYGDAWAWLAEARRQAGDARGAAAAAERALTLDGDKGLAFLVRAMARGSLGDARGQAEDFKKAARYRPGLFAAQARSLGLSAALKPLGLRP